MAFDATDLSPHEQYVVDRIRNGDVADFTSMQGGKPAIRAGFLRRLMLQLEPDWAVRTPGVRLTGVRIEGALDLTDCSGAGGAGLPALALVECDIAEAVDVSHARLARLSLSGSRLARLVGAGAAIDGAADISHIAPAGADGHESLTVILDGAQVGGDFAANGAKLARPVESVERALSMENARVGGSVVLNASFEALGCVWLVGARIGASLQCGGGKFLNRTPDAKGAALVVENAEIAGAVLLCSGFAAEGEVRFEGARINGGLVGSGAAFICAAASTLAPANVIVVMTMASRRMGDGTRDRQSSASPASRPRAPRDHAEPGTPRPPPRRADCATCATCEPASQYPHRHHRESRSPSSY